jgi:Helicase conserved C-terminal domain
LWWQWKRISVDTSVIDMTIKGLSDDIRTRLERLPGQLANDPGATVVRHALGVAKADAVLPSLCEELLGTASPCVVVAHHGAVCDLLAHGFTRAGLTFVRVDGGTSPAERVERMAAFQSGAVNVFLGSIGAMQTGVTLTRAHRIVIVEPGWTGDSNVQVVKRIHRISQTHACRAELLVAAGTLEEAVMRQVEAEIAMAESIIDGGTRPIRESHSEW